MKKGIEWLNLMTRKEQVFFLKNLSEFPLQVKSPKPSIAKYLNSDFKSFFDFIDESFDWGQTKEGFAWWNNFATKYT